MESPKLRVAFLVGNDSPSTRRSMEAVCQLQGVEPAGILLDTAFVPFRRRVKNLFRNICANGWSYPVFRILEAARTATTAAVQSAAVSRAEVAKVLKAAFPERSFSLAELARKYGMTIRAAGNLNGADAIRVLAEYGADLGIVLGTRILKPEVFGVPRMGCINLHKGKVPEYRGMPPGFWELYDGTSAAGVTVHFMDRGLDTGDIVATGAVAILKTDTPESLLEKLHEEGARVLASAVSMIRDGIATSRPQEKVSIRPRSRPTRRDVAFLQQKLPHWKRVGDVSTIVRNLYVILAYYSGLYWVVRQWHRGCKFRGAIFLHHRVNDYSKDILTVDPETFAAQLLAISSRYAFSSTAALVDCIRTNTSLRPTTIAVHFDDCYRDILTNGAPILKALNLPACAFINSGFIDTDRSFAHDVARCPFAFEKLRTSDVQAWSDIGLEVGAHTVNHVDLGKCAGEDAHSEIVECGTELAKIIGKPVDLFSFPFGLPENINAENERIIQSAGYAALFSAYGGLIGPHTNSRDIPRIGASSESPAVYCLLQIEGLTLRQLASAFRNVRNRFNRVAVRQRQPA